MLVYKHYFTFKDIILYNLFNPNLSSNLDLIVYIELHVFTLNKICLNQLDGTITRTCPQT